MTNAHVLSSGTSVSLKTWGDKAGRKAFPVYVDTETDVAVLYCQGAPSHVLPLAIGHEPRPGMGILVLGNPEGLEFSASDGIVRAIREVSGLGSVIQITAPISHGSSGGPVIDLQGRAIGMSTAMMLEGQNLNFAVRSETLAQACSAADSILQGAIAAPGGLEKLGERHQAETKSAGIDAFRARLHGLSLFDLTRRDVEALFGKPDAEKPERRYGSGGKILRIGALIYYPSVGLIFGFDHSSDDQSQHCVCLYITLLEHSHTVEPPPDYEVKRADDTGVVTMMPFTGRLAPPVAGGWLRERVLSEFRNAGAEDRWDETTVRQMIQLYADTTPGATSQGAFDFVKEYVDVLCPGKDANVKFEFDIKGRLETLFVGRPGGLK